MMTRNDDLRLGTWNIHMAIGRDKKRNLARIAAVIREMAPDVIGLQEVDNHINERGNDLEALRRMTGLKAIAGPTMKKPTGDYGNALLTRLPVKQVERHEISVPGREPRGLLIAHLEWSDNQLQVAVTHLGLRPAERRLQVKEIIRILSNGNRPALVLMGDFNEWLFWGRPLRWLHHHFGRFSSPPTFPSNRPLLRLDHILCNPEEQLDDLDVHKSLLAKTASDHLPLTAVYRSLKNRNN